MGKLQERGAPTVEAKQFPVDVVLSGSYRKDFNTLRQTYEQLLDLGCKVLSPSNVTAVNEVDGFVYMKGEETQAPDAIESRHLDAIQKSEFIWLHAPDGYVGTSASLEVGFANAVGVPVFASEAPSDSILKAFVKVVDSPQTAIQRVLTPGFNVPGPRLTAFQRYYRRAAIQRGYASESPRDSLLLMVEEVGELARAIRKRENLVRHGRTYLSPEGSELADVFLYVVHLANTLNVDLDSVVPTKERVNIERALLHR